MRVVVTATAPGLEAHVDPRLDGAAFFTTVDTDTMKADSVPNTARDMPRDTEERVAREVANMGAQALISDHVSPKAHEIISSAGMKYYPYSGGLVEDAVYQLRKGELSTMEDLSRMHDVPSGVGSASGRGAGPEAEGQGYKAERPSYLEKR